MEMVVEVVDLQGRAVRLVDRRIGFKSFWRRKEEDMPCESFAA